MLQNQTFINGRIFTGDSKCLFLPCGFVRTEGDLILEVGPMSDYQPLENESVTDLGGKIITPGLISTHYHFYGQFARGMQVPRPMANWQQVLSRMWWEMDRQLDEESLYYSTMMGLIEGMKCGTTTYFDHNASPGFIDGSLDVIRKAVKEAGARAALSYEVTDRNGKSGALAGIRENERMARACAAENGDMVRAMFGLHASYTLDDDTLDRCQSVQEGLHLGYHIHMAEAAADVSDCYRRFDMHVTDRLAERGILNGQSIAAHCVHVGPKQWATMAKAGVTAAHNVQSNTNNGVGISPVCAMLDSGVHVALGGDGYGSDLHMELSLVSMMQHLAAGDPSVCTQEHMMLLAYENPARLMRNVFGYSCGTLSRGAKADFSILSYDPPTPMNAQNAFSHILCGAPGHVDTVMIAGKPVVKGGKCVNLDEEYIFAHCREAAAKLWKRMP